MGLSEFWETTPGEVMTVIYAAGERQLDALETGVYSTWLGRVVSHMKKPDPSKVLRSRRGRRRGEVRNRGIDVERTRTETARWRRRLAQADAQREAKTS